LSPNYHDQDEVENLDTVALRKKAQGLPIQELDRDVAELSNDIKFLESQLKEDLASYSSEELSIAHRKIANYKLKLEILEAEITQRG